MTRVFCPLTPNPTHLVIRLKQDFSFLRLKRIPVWPTWEVAWHISGETGGGEVEWAVSGRSGYEAWLAVQRGSCWGRRCHSISRRRRGRVAPPAEVALLLLPMVFTTIHHTFTLLFVLWGTYEHLYHIWQGKSMFLYHCVTRSCWW